MHRSKKLPSEIGADRPEQKREGLPVIILLLLFATGCAWLLPPPGAFPFQFSLDQPWNHADLYAPYDFEVVLSDKETQENLNRLQAEHGPWFELDAGVEPQLIQQFDELFDEQIRISRDSEFLENNKAYRSLGKSLLARMYKRGMLAEEEPSIAEVPIHVLIHIKSGESIIETPLNTLYTPRTARAFLVDTLPFTALNQPEKLLPLLEKSLAPNLFYNDSLTNASLRQKISGARRTGIIVNKGEPIIRTGDLVDQTSYLKLQTLKSREDNVPFWKKFAGHFILAFLIIGVFWLVLLDQPREINQEGRQQLILFLAIFLALIGVRLSTAYSSTLALLFPLYILPFILSRTFPYLTGISAWAVAGILGALSMSWGLSWFIIQAAGLATAWLYLFQESKWIGRLTGIAAAVIVQLITWFGLGISGHLPSSIWQSETVITIAASGIVALFLVPVRSLLPEKTDNNQLYS